MDVDRIEQNADIQAASEGLRLKMHRALVFLERGNIGSARILCDEVLRQQPKHAEALNLSGVIAAQMRDPKKAAILFGKAIQADPLYAAAHCNRGLAQQEMGLPERALESFDCAIAIDARHAEAHFNRGNIFKELKRLDAALDSYDRAIAIRPNYAAAHSNRGVVLNHLKRFDAAIASYDRAIAIDPGYANAYRNRAYTRLLNGDLERGWADHEWRPKLIRDAVDGGARESSQPIWRGQAPLPNKRILLYSEQGLGDTIQFCRYVPMVRDLGGEVILEVQPPLASLLGQLRGVSQVVNRETALPDFDYECPLVSLPLAFNTSLDTIPDRAGYLRGDPAKRAKWNSRLGPKIAPRIGLVWSGSRTHQNDRNRSIPLADWIPHLPPGFQYVSLQKDLREHDKKALKANDSIVNIARDLDDFSDTAALCECMEAIVSVDTSVAHLCGALGRPTWVMLPYIPDWRWMLDRVDSPWYSTVRLYRQGRAEDWAGVFARLQADLMQISMAGRS